MFRKGSIRSILAGLVLLLFAFSITPKNFLHECAANHKNASLELPASDQQQVETSPVKCTCDHFVAGSAFIETPQDLAVLSLAYLNDGQEPKPVPLVSSTHFFFSLRGPPAV